ncbi:MAG TPA: 3-isopropylmalate dehydratase small subunit [Hyphomicrobiaceae bacterium]|nr:3-isopropylmalate dehydratase small subunit [Hyphomicrobiaceae bacterium]
MEKFTVLKGLAAPLAVINVDTDMIIPKQFLKGITRSGLGKHLFHEMRFDEDGRENPAFVLNREPYRKAQIIVSGDNFGCGSSREHAPWAILDFGIRAIVAPSFADIFYTNCFKNGILAVKLPQGDVAQLMADAESAASATMTIDLAAQTIRRHDGREIGFEIDAFRKRCMLGGLDDIGLTLEHTEKIAAFEGRQRRSLPWLYDRKPA